MVLRVQIVDGEWRIVIPSAEVEALKLREGTPVEVVPLHASSGVQYISFEEGMEAYRATEHLHGKTYRELAKGPGAPDDWREA